MSTIMRPLRLRVSIAVEDAVENRGHYRAFVSHLFEKGLRHYSTTITWLSFLGVWNKVVENFYLSGSYSCRRGEAEIV